MSRPTDLATLGLTEGREGRPARWTKERTWVKMPAVVGFDAKRTQVAQSAFDFSRYFSGIFDAVRVAGAAPRRPVLVAPEGMSTSGGKRARQSVVLQPDDAMSAAVTVGWVDVGERQSMLRTHAALESIHRERFRGRVFDVDRASYATFFEQARSFLASCGFDVKVEAEGGPASVGGPGSQPFPMAPRVPQDLEQSSEASGGVSWLAVIAAFFIGVIVGGLIVYARLVWMK